MAWRRAGNDTAANPIINSISSGGDRPSESLSLNFTKIAYKNLNMTDTNAAGSPDTVTYDVAQAKVV